MAGKLEHMFAPAAESLTREELAALQLRRLRKTLRHAYDNVAPFRARCEQAKVGPDDLRTLDDLRRFPFARKDDLRESYPYGLLAVPRERLARVHASSGTTGKPTVVGYTQGDLDVWAHLMARSLACAGARPGDVIHNSVGYGLFTGGLGFHDGGQLLGCTVVPVSGGNTERQVMLLQDLGGQVFCATPSYALNVAEVAEEMGVNLKNGTLRVGAFGAEPWSQSMRRELESRLGLRAVNFYGLSEIIGPGVAVECARAQDGLHGWEDHFLFEVVDPESGERLAEGERGELVITNLTKEALPMVRYRTGDLTALRTDPCVCGRHHLRLAPIAGRVDDMVIVRGVNVFPSQVEALLADVPGLVPQYRLVLTRPGALDEVAVEVEAGRQVAATDYESLARRAAAHLKSMLGLTCGVSVLAPGALPRGAGKAVRVVDRRGATE